MGFTQGFAGLIYFSPALFRQFPSLAGNCPGVTKEEMEIHPTVTSEPQF